MRFLRLSIFASVVLHPSTAFAEDDPKFDPSQNFRPDNVTGLSALYDWIGSYYNGTAVLEIFPEARSEDGESLCEKLENSTISKSFTSILSITQRGLYNEGPNPFNLMLSLVPPHFGLATLPPANGSGLDLVQSGLGFVLASTWPTTYREVAEGYVRGSDNFNFRSSHTNTSHYTVDGMVQRTPTASADPMRPFNISLPSCHSDNKDDEVAFDGLEMTKPPYEDWKGFEVPKLTVGFDRQTANLTMTGSFSAYSFSTSNETLGSFKLSLRAVLDPYHSDSLIMDSAHPRWMKTVGFGNNSANIGFQESGSIVTKAPCGFYLIMGLVAVFLVY